MNQMFAAILLMVYYFYFLNMDRIIKFKPFNCEKCLPFWIAIILLFLPKIVSNYIIIAFGSGIAVPILLNEINKYFRK